MSDYPEHDKLQKAREELRTQEIGEFIEWLGSTGRYICDRREYETLGGFRTNELMPIQESIQYLLAEYAEIDLDAIEREKRAMLDAIREANAL